jgi:hypothetical protein
MQSDRAKHLITKLLAQLTDLCDPQLAQTKVAYYTAIM